MEDTEEELKSLLTRVKEESENLAWNLTSKKTKSLSEEALQVAVKRREAKSKGEKERYTHLNAEFQRRAKS